ncbi:regulatory protein RecX [Zooshikella ganghwensis]|uniref:Regulatory protein RecX n=1 Tax=Zooshikella ganghwensis TaxID=202772 RepID=A0A4P9VNH3_9GAMM|nr:regulatory protein RecX [Zooshikella ganghwensis]RDH44998.1 regulatory protein RecX [Zooshikella ganghwensis]
MTISLAVLRQSALTLLARRDFSVAELASRLRKKTTDENLIQQVIEQLLEKGWLDDYRAAASFVRQRIDRGHGPLRIRQDMRARGFTVEMIEQTLEEQEPDWEEVAFLAWQRKFSSIPKNDKEKTKQIRFLQYRGFSYDIIRCVLNRE